MLTRTRWRVVEEVCGLEEAESRWREACCAGACGAVTSRGSGIRGRDWIRLYWETVPGAALPEGEDLVEEDWTPHWRESLGSVSATPRVTLVPGWHEPVAESGTVLRIDPGMAFGAGDHPTTRLCVRILGDLADRGQLADRVLDVGAGTGVLSLAAAALGADAVDALDIDPFCFAACRRNARLNRLEKVVRPLLCSLDLVSGTYPLVMANIVSGQLEALAPLLRERVEAEGRILLSGFEAGAEGDVRSGVLGPFGVESRAAEDGWVALLARKREEA